MTTVSVIIPCYNTEQYVEQAIDSVLEQTYKDYEIILIDDCSTDRTLSILTKYAQQHPNIKLIKNETNQGPGISRNNGISIATGKYLAFHDSDDLWEASKLDKQVRFLDTHPNIGAVYCHLRFMDSTKTDVYCSTYKGNVLMQLLRGVICGTPTLMVRTDLVRLAGGFETDVHVSEDWGLCLRLATLCEFDYIPEKLFLRRTHANQISNSPEYAIADEKVVLYRALKTINISWIEKRKAISILLCRHGFLQRGCNRRVKSTLAYIHSWLINPLNLDPIKAVVMNIISWNAMVLQSRSLHNV